MDFSGVCSWRWIIKSLPSTLKCPSRVAWEGNHVACWFEGESTMWFGGMSPWCLSSLQRSILQQNFFEFSMVSQYILFMIPVLKHCVYHIYIYNHICILYIYIGIHLYDYIYIYNMTKYQNCSRFAHSTAAQWHIFQALPACQPRCQRPPPGGCRHPPAPHACGAPGMDGGWNQNWNMTGIIAQLNG